MNKLIDSLKGVSGINNKYIILIIITILVIVVIKFVFRLLAKIITRKNHNGKEVFRITQRFNVISSCFCMFAVFFIWNSSLNNIITLVSFISAGTAIALREVILNLFAGIYIKVSHPFRVEDRIQVGDIKGDVILTSSMSFKVLALGDGEQSSGIIVNIPNSQVFSNPLKNYTAGFKYIWSEMVVDVSIDCDIDKVKKKLYEIVNCNEILKSIPRKMDRALDEATSSYRIYYNNLKPIIYTKYVDGHVAFTIRFLVHPKKERMVIDDLWIKIIKEAQSGGIDLYKD